MSENVVRATRWKCRTQKIAESAAISPPQVRTIYFGLLAAEIVSCVWGIPVNFNGFRVLASLLQQRRSTEAN